MQKKDIRITNQDFIFKFRAVGIVKFNDLYLIQRINNSKFYAFPGGHVKIKESTLEALKRELDEELSFKYEIVKLHSIVQNVFDTKDKRKYHEIGYYYLVRVNDNINIKDFDVIENEDERSKTLHYRWVDLKTLKNLDFRPNVFKTLLEEPTNEVKHIIFIDDKQVIRE